MLVFKYTKTDGAEYVSHLDMLRHINKIMRRAGIKISFSKGFNPHMHIFMSAPIAVGVKSQSEYCFVDCEEDAELFKDKFNAYTFNGVKCLSAVNVNKKVSVQGLINRAEYKISGLCAFNEQDILNAEEFFITDKKGDRKEVRKKIYSLKRDADGNLIARLGFGNDALRPDLFCNEIKSLQNFTGDVIITKTKMFVGDVDFEDYLKQTQN